MMFTNINITVNQKIKIGTGIIKANYAELENELGIRCACRRSQGECVARGIFGVTCKNDGTECWENDKNCNGFN